MSHAAKSLATPHFDMAALRSAVGDAAFARGSAYAREGRVRLLSVQPGVVRAQVSGTEVYAVVLEGSGRAVSGDCTCRAFEDWGACKHLVAVALTVNAQPDAVAEAGQRDERLKLHLQGLGADALAERLLQLARRDPGLWRELELESAVATDPDEVVFARLAEAIDAAVDVGEFVDWRGAGSVAEELTGVVVQIEKVFDAGRAALALRALDRLLESGEALLESVDDSDGEVGGALAAARDLHVNACLAAKADPIQLAATLFERELTSEYGLWEETQDEYAEPLGAEGLAEYRRLAQAAWDAASGKRGEARDRRRLTDMLDAFAARDGDIETRIALRAADAQSSRDYQAIAELCLSAHRADEALKWAEEGLWKTEDKPDAHLMVFTADICRRLRRKARARELLWAAFALAPSLDILTRLKTKAASPGAVVDEAVRILEAKIARRDRYAWSGDLLVQILSGEGRLDQAWAASAHGCSQPTLEELARASETSRPDKALALYAELAERSILAANNGAYAAAVKQIARIARLRRTLGRDAEQRAYVEDLARRHKAKRNFIRLLEDKAAWPKA
ncbi:MAG TPA: SWIM zinc finger family protein [Caulobacteraceae bacterium]